MVEHFGLVPQSGHYIAYKRLMPEYMSGIECKKWVKANDEDIELSCLEEEVLDGKFPVLIGHPESWGSARGQKLLLEMKKKNMILLIAIDEFHQVAFGLTFLFEFQNKFYRVK